VWDPEWRHTGFPKPDRDLCPQVTLGGSMPKTVAMSFIGPGIMGSIVLGALCVGTESGSSCVNFFQTC